MVYKINKTFILRVLVGICGCVALCRGHYIQSPIPHRTNVARLVAVEWQYVTVKSVQKDAEPLYFEDKLINSTNFDKSAAHVSSSTDQDLSLNDRRTLYELITITALLLVILIGLLKFLVKD